VIAGRVSKSGIVGYIGSVPIPEVVMGMNAFIQGMRTVNPNGKMKVVWINGWYDPAKEGDAAKVLIDQGADIIAQITDSAAPLRIAEQRRVHGFGQSSDMIKFAPNAQLSSSVDDWDAYYTQRIQAAMDGSWKSQDIWGGFAAGMLHMAPFTNMPDDIARAAQAVEDGIKGGKIVIFKGPIKDQNGKIKVAEGGQLSDDELHGMNWLAEGIQGKLPR
jgi:basic membrane protein A and related proteins